MRQAGLRPSVQLSQVAVCIHQTGMTFGPSHLQDGVAELLGTFGIEFSLGCLSAGRGRGKYQSNSRWCQKSYSFFFSVLQTEA